MKFQVERDVLAEAVAWAARTLPTRPAQPMLAGLLIEADKNSLTLSAFDYEVSSRVSVDAGISEGGKVLVSGKLFADISRSLPNQPVTGSINGSRLELKCGRSVFALPTLPPDDYPQLPPLPKTSGSVKAKTFSESVAQVAVAAGRDDALPMLTGIRVEIEGNTITLAATDRYRLAVRELSWSAQDAAIETTSLLRARTLADAAKSLIGTSQVSIALSPANTNEKLVGFISDGKTMTSRVLDGSFPPFRHLLPSESTAEAIIEVAPFLDSVRRVALVTDKTVPLRLNFSNNSLVLEAGTGDEAQASEKLDINYKGEEINIAFNPTFLTDGLNAINTAFVHIAFTGANKPAVLTGQTEPTSAPITNYKYLLMPMRYSS